MAETEWYWVENGRQRGPVPADQLRRFFADGILSDESLVWCDGVPEWVPFRETELVPSGTITKSEPPTPRTPRLNPDYRPQFRSILVRSWTLLFSDFWPLFGFCLLASFLLGVASQFLFPMFFLMYPMVTGYAYYVLRRIRGQRGSIDDLFDGFRQPFKDLALLNLVLSIPMVLLAALLVIGIATVIFLAGETEEPSPAIFVAGTGVWIILAIVVSTLFQVVANFACLLIVDCGCGWRQAMALGWQATRRHLVKHLLVFLLLGVLAVAGIFAFYFGVFITSAWTWIAMVYLYEDAFGERSPSLQESDLDQLSESGTG